MKLLYFLLWFGTFSLVLHVCVAPPPIRRIARERGIRRGSYFYHVNDGFYYHLERRRNGRIFYRCVQSTCPGRAAYGYVEGFRRTRQHNHRHDHDHREVRALRRNILDRCRNLDYAPQQQILAEERERFRQDVRLRVDINNMRGPMARARETNYPQLPRTMRELTNILRDDQYRALAMTSDSEEFLYAGSTTATDGSHHILFMSRRLRQHLNEMSVWFSDGTFWAAPRRPATHQIFTIVTVWDNTVIPVAWALMECRTEEAYTAVLQLLRMRLMEEREELGVTRIITDFERGLQNAWQAVFPEAILQGCLWHACRAFIRHAVKELQLLRWMRAVPHIHEIIRLCCALPLLPVRHIRRGLVLITREARQQGNFLFGLLQPFLRYVFNTWIRNRRRRRLLSVYRSIFRTNNARESANSRLNAHVGTAHPNIFSLLKTLRRIEAQSYDSVVALRAGRRPARKRKARSIRNDRRIRNLERGLRHPPGRMDNAILRFLHAASHLLDDVIADIVGDDAEEPQV